MPTSPLLKPRVRLVPCALHRGERNGLAIAAFAMICGGSSTCWPVRLSSTGTSPGNQELQSTGP